MNFIERSRHLVGFDCTPRNGNYEAVVFLSELAKADGFHVEVQSEMLEGLEQANLILRPQAQPPADEILLQTHLDTADAGHFSQWTKTQANPFNASIYNDDLVGLGTADAKLDFLCKMEAAKSLLGKNLKTPFVLVGTFGAESGMTGAIRLIRRKKIKASRALIGEPTQFHLGVAGMGIAVVEISIPYSLEERTYRREHDLLESTSSQSKMFSGRSSPDSNARENAILRMLDYLSHLPEGIAIMDLNGGVNHNSLPSHAVLEIDLVAGFKDPIVPKISAIYQAILEVERDMQKFTEEGFNPPNPTLNLGVIRSTEENVQLIGSCRLPPSVTDEDYSQWMRPLESVVHKSGATFRVKDYRRGFRTELSSSWVKGATDVLAEMGLNAQTTKLGVSTEASVFQRLGIECLVWGPGQSVGNSHAPNESIKLSELRTASEFYRRLLERFCL